MNITARDGRVYRDGVNTDADLAFKLLRLWRRTATDRTDWFAPFARDLADRLEAAMREAGMIEHNSERAA